MPPRPRTERERHATALYLTGIHYFVLAQLAYFRACSSPDVDPFVLGLLKDEADTALSDLIGFASITGRE